MTTDPYGKPPAAETSAAVVSHPRLFGESAVSILRALRRMTESPIANKGRLEGSGTEARMESVPACVLKSTIEPPFSSDRVVPDPIPTKGTVTVPPAALAATWKDT